MKILILTSNEIRHKYLANSLSYGINEILVISESKPEPGYIYDKEPNLINEHFQLRHNYEKKYFKNNDYFLSNTLPILYKEINSPNIYDIIKNFKPELIIVFGSSIIKEPIMSLLPPEKILNIHLGISPYYRGAGTNFWPFVNNELQFVGSTILQLDSGIDTGDIICHVRPSFESTDNVHSIGCKVIQSSVSKLKIIIELINSGKKIMTTKQWSTDYKLYKINDFNEKILEKYYSNLENGIVPNFLNNEKKIPKFIELNYD